MDLAQQNILVTGATGFIGSHVVERFRNEKHAAVRALVRNPAKAGRLAELGVELIQGDLADSIAVERAVRGCTLVVHSAAQVSSVPGREAFEQSNVAGTESLLRAAAAAGVSRFVHLSSIAVFGLAMSGEITDESPRLSSGDAYCDTKLDAEEVVWKCSRRGRMTCVILRPSCVYGPGSTHWSVIPVKRLKKGKMFLVGGGRGMLNYVYIENLVDAILIAAEHERAAGEAFIVNDGATTWRDYFGAYARMTEKNHIPSVPLWAARVWVHYRNFVAAVKRESMRVPQNSLGFLVGTAVYRQSQIENRLGHRSRISLEDGLQRTEAWLQTAGFLEPAKSGK